MGDTIDHHETGTTVDQHGIYQSACSCRTALTLLAGQELPRCLGCDETVGWRLVQVVRPSQPAAPRVRPSSIRIRAAAARARFDSASGED
ncbi:MAG TPA: hypothetical protein VH062_25740 [Polyangiaceae bacterium]|jgi:hypothetical protein|nr:hypothetical protein [Polyangiaceae bacterium]